MPEWPLNTSAWSFSRPRNTRSTPRGSPTSKFRFVDDYDKRRRRRIVSTLLLSCIRSLRVDPFVRAFLHCETRIKKWAYPSRAHARTLSLSLFLFKAHFKGWTTIYAFPYSLCRIWQSNGTSKALRQYPAWQGPKKVFFARFFWKENKWLGFVNF